MFVSFHANGHKTKKNDELKKIKGDEVEEEIIKRDCKELKDILRAPNLKECFNRFTHFIDNLTSNKEYLMKFVDKHVIKNFERMIYHYFDPLIERTTNKSENYFRQTDSDRIKKIFKKPDGILDFFTFKNGKLDRKSITKKLPDQPLTASKIAIFRSILFDNLYFSQKQTLI